MINITTEMVARMKSLRQEGLTNREIAEKMQIGLDAVYRHIGKNPARVPKAVRQEILDRYQAGETYEGIAAAVGLSKAQTVYYVQRAAKAGEIEMRYTHGKIRKLSELNLEQIKELGSSTAVEDLRRYDIIPNRNIRGLSYDEYARLIEMARAREEE